MPPVPAEQTPAAPAGQKPAVPGAQTPPPAGQVPAAPPAEPVVTPAPGTPGVVVAPVVASRMFTAPTGLLLMQVRPERVADFEKFLGYVQDALAKSKDPTVRAQARGWRMFRAVEPGPNAQPLYVFIIDPAVPKVEYGFGEILAEAYPDTLKLQEIWKLYQTAVTGGGNLLNLEPVVPGATPKPVVGTPAPGAPATTPAPAAPSTPPPALPGPVAPDSLPRPAPPDADRNRR